MSEFNAFTQGNGYELGSLLVQFGFLVAGIWFASNLLRTMRVFQEQIGALLKLSITAAPIERHSANSTARGLPAETSPNWQTPSETQTVNQPGPSAGGPSRSLIARHRLLLWLQAPMSTSKVAPRHRVTSWLRAPISG
jgi:hypothetical protein